MCDGPVSQTLVVVLMLTLVGVLTLAQTTTLGVTAGGAETAGIWEQDRMVAEAAASRTT